MKPASPELIALLASRQFYAVDLYEFMLSGGQALRYCAGDQDIVWNGFNWGAGGVIGPYFERKGGRAKCHWKVGLEVDTLVFDVLPGSATLFNLPFLIALQQGVFDNAELTLYRAFMPYYGNTSNGAVTMFVGRVAEVEAGRGVATFTINSHLELLNQPIPRNVYQAGCGNTLFDSICGLVASDYAVTASVSALSSASVIYASLSQRQGYFNLGKLRFVSGVNNGIARSVKSYLQGAPGSIELTSPFPSVPAVSDNFIIYPGCDKTQSTCDEVYHNLRNFRGFPYVPENATAV